MARDLEAEQTRGVLRNVAAYRVLCEHVRRKATGELVFGGIMLAVWYSAFPNRDKFELYGLIYLALAGLEFTVGFWNKFRPSPEGVFVVGLLLFAFGGANAIRGVVIWQQRADQFGLVLLLLAAFWAWQGVGQMRSYFRLRRAFADRPTAAHLRWFNDLLREVRTADPDADPDALDLPTRPPVRGKLLGDTAVFLAGGEVVVAARRDVFIERRPAGDDPDRPPAGVLVIEDGDYGRFPLDPANWRNYAAWKAAGDEPPLVRPA